MKRHSTRERKNARTKPYSSTTMNGRQALERVAIALLTAQGQCEEPPCIPSQG